MASGYSAAITRVDGTDADRQQQLPAATARLWERRDRPGASKSTADIADVQMLNRFRKDGHRTMKPTKRSTIRRRIIWVSVAALLQLTWFLGAAATPSADKGKRFIPDKHINTPQRVSEFRFARMQYPGGAPEYIKNWYTDYPAMDEHLTSLAQRFTNIEVGAPVLVDPSSESIFGLPLVYSVEPEQMVLGPEDANNLREYLARGGLWFADDFHGDEEFNQFLDQIHRVLPEASVVELDTSHPLFHCFYDLTTIIQVTNDGIAKCRECDQWENGPSGKIPKVFAVLDEHGRISILMAWNTDLGDGLEWADDPTYPENYSAYAFKFVSNVIVYTMTH